MASGTKITSTLPESATWDTGDHMVLKLWWHTNDPFYNAGHNNMHGAAISGHSADPSSNNDSDMDPTAAGYPTNTGAFVVHVDYGNGDAPWTLTPSLAVVAGTFVLTVNGFTVPAQNVTVTAAALQAAINTAMGQANGYVTVTGTTSLANNHIYTIDKGTCGSSVTILVRPVDNTGMVVGTVDGAAAVGAGREVWQSGATVDPSGYLGWESTRDEMAYIFANTHVQSTYTADKVFFTGGNPRPVDTRHNRVRVSDLAATYALIIGSD